MKSRLLIYKFINLPDVYRNVKFDHSSIQNLRYSTNFCLLRSKISHDQYDSRLCFFSNNVTAGNWLYSRMNSSAPILPGVGHELSVTPVRLLCVYIYRHGQIGIFRKISIQRSPRILWSNINANRRV